MAEADSGRCQPLLTSQFVVGYITIKDSTSAEELATYDKMHLKVFFLNLSPGVVLYLIKVLVLICTN